MAVALASTVTAESPAPRRLLGGPDASLGPEHLDDHLRRLGPRPVGGSWLIEELERAGLTGKGGAGFPVWRKWAGIAGRQGGDAVIVVNASEGEPLSAKDRTLLSIRPHLILDGAALAAESVGAGEVVVYVAEGSGRAASQLPRLLRERRTRHREARVGVVATAHAYVAGESSAAARRISGGPALPRFTPPHVSERGVFEQPTLVQNAETLAHIALIARRGAGWFRELGTDSAPGTTLMTLAGNVRRPGVHEVELGSTVRDATALAGGPTSPPAGALLGGYFGTWLPAEGLAGLPLDGTRAPLGCGVLALLPAGSCGLVESARILAYLAAQAAGQCGPCVYGLAALREAVSRLAVSNASRDDVERIRRWAVIVKGRGACRHPDGAAGQLESALDAFADHLPLHLSGERCAGLDAAGFPPPPGVTL